MTEHVPTAAELARMRPPLAFEIREKGQAAYYRITPEGHALLGWIMRENGKELAR